MTHPQISAYFESEAARPFVAADDCAFVVAVSAIPDDDGAKWRRWLESSDAMVKRAVTAAYEAQAAKDASARAARPGRAREAHDAALANGSSRNAAVRAARAIWPDFKPGKAGR